MENNIYRIDLTNKRKIEFHVIDTNEINPHIPIKELGLTIFEDENMQFGELNENEIDSLIRFLCHCKQYISNYNQTSKALYKREDNPQD